MSKNKCQLCKELFDDDETYEYRGFMFCEEHFDDGIKRVDEKRSFVMETTEKSIRSQADGEWNNGGYKTMKTGADGRPITKVKEPEVLKEYEDGKL